MERRYIPIRAFGRPMQVFEHIRRILQAEKLTRAIPAVKFEKGAHKEFFIFLTVQGQETADFLRQLQTIFTKWNLKGNIFHEFCSYDDIKSMVSRGEIETHSLNALKYRSSWSNDIGDPFDLSDAVSNIKDLNNVLIDEKYDQLVHWLSASAEGTWQTFIRVCNILQLAGDVKETKSIFQAFNPSRLHRKFGKWSEMVNLPNDFGAMYYRSRRLYFNWSTNTYVG